MKKKIVLLQGAFDLINWGHIKAFQLAKSYGTYLIVALNTDKLLMEYKGKQAVLPYYQKKFIIESCKYVDKVVPATTFSPMALLQKYTVDVYCLTEEWKSTKDEEILYMQEKGGTIKYLPRFKGVIPTSKIKEILLNEAKEERSKT